MSQYVVLGPTSKVRINAQTFAVTSGSIRYNADVPECTDSENTGYKEQKSGGLVAAEINFQGQISTTVSPFTAPLSITPSSSIALIVYPKGTSYTGFTFTSVIVRDFNIEFRVQGSQPVTFNFSGVSNGSFTVPSD